MDLENTFDKINIASGDKIFFLLEELLHNLVQAIFEAAQDRRPPYMN